jgi:sulfite reductase alpha subunit-like flavoprotein/cytochrome b involved in lipid metabolism
MFLQCMAEVHGCFQSGVELIVRCQEAVMNRDSQTLLREMVALKDLVDQLPYVFHKISVNPNAGEQFANPVEWGQRYAKFSAPLSKRVPALSGLALPLFLLMDAFIGRTNYTSFLGVEAVHLRRWLPLNIRAFITAIEQHYRVPEYVRASGHQCLEGVLEGIIESYAGERGFMGTHRYKVYGFLEVVAKTGRAETNGNAGAGDSEGRPWEQVHHTLSDSMKERLGPYRGEVKVEPQQMRGSFEECRFQAKILERQAIDHDPSRSTGMVTFDLSNTGITFQPGDRLAVMPMNASHEVAKISAVLGLEGMMDAIIPLEQGSEWARFSKHLQIVSKKQSVVLTVGEILKQGHLAPLTKELVLSVHRLLRSSSRSTQQILASQEWPVKGSLGDLLQLAISEVRQETWDHAFDLNNLDWLPKLLSLEVPRTYSISNSSIELLPSMIDLTVSRTETARDSIFAKVQPILPLYGVSSGFLNPAPHMPDYLSDTASESSVLIGVSRPIQFQLPSSTTVPVAMFAGGSGIAPFRGFWQKRITSGIGRNILFLGVQSREKFVHEAEVRSLVQSGSLELHAAFSRDRRGLIYDTAMRELIEQDMEPRYIDTAIVDQGRLVSELVSRFLYEHILRQLLNSSLQVMSKSQGGLGGHLYICGSVSVYETVMSGFRKAIYKYQASTHAMVDSLLATAFAERRFMLDIFMSPRSIPAGTPTVPISKLAQHTGHRKNFRMWVGVHGGVYDVTDFLPMHPGGTLIVAASAGLDATKTFHELAHDTNPEVSSLLSKYFIGYLGTKPQCGNAETSQLYDMWNQYLRMSIESLTTLSFETTNILEDSKIWFSGGQINIGGIRKFYQFQSRLMQNGFSSLFGAKFQEIYLKISYSLANAITPDVRLPDVVGTITRAQAGPDAAKAMREISAVGQFVSNNARAAHFHENGILKYAQKVTELDITFLEQVRDEVAQGIDAFDLVASLDELTGSKQIKLASYLLSILERIAAQVEAYYGSLSQESIYRPEIENNPARTRWHNVRQKIVDASFFVLSKPLSISHNDGFASGMPTRSGLDVSFAQIFASAQQTIQSNSQSSQSESAAQLQEPRRLADMHTARAAQNSQAPSTFESQQQNVALKRMSNFISANMSNIRRLSRLPVNYDFSGVMAAYGKEPASTPSNISPTASQSHTRVPSELSNTMLQSSQVRHDSPPLPAPLAIRTNNRTPSLERNLQLNHRQSPLPSLPPQNRNTHSSPPSESSLSRSMSVATMHMNRRQPPRSSTPLPASPRASLALSHSASIRRKMSTDVPPVPVAPNLVAGMNALKMAGTNGDELIFQQLRAKN